MSFTLSLNNPSRTFKHGHIIMGGLSGEERSGVKDKGAEEEGEEENSFWIISILLNFECQREIESTVYSTAGTARHFICHVLRKCVNVLLLWRILNGRGLPNCLTELPSLKCLSASLNSRDSHPFANVLRPSPSGSPSASPTLTCALQEYFFQCVLLFNVAKV